MFLKFINSNTKWLYNYFEKSKWLFEILSLFFVFETFIYSVDIKNDKEFGYSEVSALKIIFWILIFIVNFLLYIQTDAEYTEEDDFIKTPIFKHDALGKYIMRLIIYILLSVNAVLLFRELKIALYNSYFVILWIAIGVAIVLEILRAINIYFNKK